MQDDFAQHPALAGKKVLFATFDPADKSKVGFYTGHDSRPGFLADLGMPAPTLVSEETAKTQAFYSTVSTEQADRLDDVDPRRHVRRLLHAHDAAGRSGPVEGPGHQGRPRRGPAGLDPPRRGGQPLAAQHPLGRRAVLRPARGRAAAGGVSRALAPTRPATAAPQRRPAGLRVTWAAGSLVLLAVAVGLSVAVGARTVPLGDVVAALTGGGSGLDSAVVTQRVRAPSSASSSAPPSRSPAP